MRIVVDRSKCQGYANCLLAADDVFDLDDSGVAVVKDEHPPRERLAAVQEAVRTCPVQAISVLEE